MDGVFMKFLGKLFLYLALSAVLIWFGGVLKDKQQLQGGIVRLHVVANSDSAEDQSNKLAVRDAVVKYLQEKMDAFQNSEQAKAFLETNIEKIEAIANRTLQQLGTLDRVKVILALEEFGTRIYETFALPAGIYDALRIEIGNAEGQNWWCVVFPSFCVPKTTDQFQSTAVSSGFSDRVTNTVSGEPAYKIRFFVLDWIGKIENFFS